MLRNFRNFRNIRNIFQFAIRTWKEADAYENETP